MNFNQLQSEFWKESGKESAVDTSLYLNARNDRNPKSKNLFIHKQKKNTFYRFIEKLMYLVYNITKHIH